VKLEFDEFVIDTGTRQLLHRKEESHLTPKAFDLLACLVENRPNALSKAALHDRLWPSTYVAEANLAILIAEIRAALGDSSKQPRYIRTVHRFGYAFAGEVTELREPGIATRRAAICWLMGRVRRFALGEGEHIVGRAPEVDVLLDSESVSRRHARIVVSGKASTVEDLASKNGTWLHGRRIAGIEALRDGDQLRFGKIELKYRSSFAGATTRSTTPRVS
jgi:DNA-binding winged helix-turn-helix (wHTH) protein